MSFRVQISHVGSGLADTKSHYVLGIMGHTMSSNEANMSRVSFGNSRRSHGHIYILKSFLG